jgi:hypothetical protein
MTLVGLGPVVVCPDRSAADGAEGPAVALSKFHPAQFAESRSTLLLAHRAPPVRGEGISHLDRPASQDS